MAAAGGITAVRRPRHAPAAARAGDMHHRPACGGRPRRTATQLRPSPGAHPVDLCQRAGHLPRMRTGRAGHGKIHWQQYDHPARPHDRRGCTSCHRPACRERLGPAARKLTHLPYRRISGAAADLRWQERQGKLDIPCRTADAIRRKAYALYLDVCKPGARLRSIGVRATDLLPAEVEQPSFLPEYQAVQRREKLENTIDSIRSRFGHFSIQPAANLLDTQLSGLNPQAAIDPFTA